MYETPFGYALTARNHKIKTVISIDRSLIFLDNLTSDYRFTHCVLYSLTVKVIQIKATSTLLYLYLLNRFREKNRGNRTGFHEKHINFRNRLFLRLNIPPIC